MKIIQDSSAHRLGGWQGQYYRMMRWKMRFDELEKSNEYLTNPELYFDTLFTCIQNIFYMKDWLKNDAKIENKKLNDWINKNEEIGICRDICNGTKHFEITQPSVDAEFEFFKKKVHFSRVWNLPPSKIIIIAGSKKYDPIRLLSKCIELVNKLISSELHME